jgi:SAM-dependent methyltransferase
LDLGIHRRLRKYSERQAAGPGSSDILPRAGFFNSLPDRRSVEVRIGKEPGILPQVRSRGVDTNLDYKKLRKMYREFARRAAADWQWGYDLSPDEKSLFEKLITCGPVLDAGCGVGRAFSYFENRGIDVVGMDAVPEMLARAQEQIPLAELVEGELRRVGSIFPPAAFGAVICLGNTISGLIEEEEREEFVRGVAGILKPDGVFCVDCVFPNRDLALAAGNEILIDKTAEGGGLGQIFAEKIGGKTVRCYQYHLSERELGDLLSGAGFSFDLHQCRPEQGLTMAVCRHK